MMVLPSLKTLNLEKKIFLKQGHRAADPVLLINDDGLIDTVDLRPVKPGQRQVGDLQVVESGIEPNETVVVTGQLALAPGAKVDPKPYDSSQPPADGSKAAASSGQ